MKTYIIIHFRAGALKETVTADSERNALRARFGVEPSSLPDGRPVVRYGLKGTDVIFHEYTAQEARSESAEHLGSARRTLAAATTYAQQGEHGLLHAALRESTEHLAAALRVAA